MRIVKKQCQIFLEMSVENFLKMSVKKKIVTNKGKLYLKKYYDYKN